MSFEVKSNWEIVVNYLTNCNDGYVGDYLFVNEATNEKVRELFVLIDASKTKWKVYAKTKKMIVLQRIM